LDHLRVVGRGALQVVLDQGRDLVPEPPQSLVAPRLAAEIEPNLVPGNAAKPRPEVIAAAETRQAPQGGQENLLCQVVHVVEVMHLAGEVAPQGQRIGVNDPPEGLGAAPGNLVQNGFDVRTIFHWPTPPPRSSSFGASRQTLGRARDTSPKGPR